MMEVLLSPVKGRTLALSEVMDPIFSEEIIGKGLAIIPRSNRIVSPVNGRVIMVSKYKYAVSIRSEQGITIIMHVGIDTCRLEGKYFNLLVEVDEEVHIGDVLIEFNSKEIAKKGYDIITPVIISNYSDYKFIRGAVGEEIEELEPLIQLLNED